MATTILETLAAEVSDDDLDNAIAVLTKHQVRAIGNISLGAVERLADGGDGASGAEYRLARVTMVLASLVVTAKGPG